MNANTADGLANASTAFEQLGAQRFDLAGAPELGLRTDECHSFAVLTLHRPSNGDSSGRLETLLKVIEEVAERLPIVFPVHPRTQKIIASLDRRGCSRVKLIPPVGYLDFLWLLSQAKLVLTDSGGILEETTALGVPCFTLRDNTERPVTVTQGTNELVGLDSAKIRTGVDTVLAGKWKAGRLPQFWDGHAAERIVDILKTGFVVRCPLGAGAFFDAGQN